MKNAGMAGAVALVGIGLITIGLSNFANRADATPAATVNAGPLEPTIVWYGTAEAIDVGYRNSESWTGSETTGHILYRAWSDGTVEAKAVGIGSTPSCSDFGPCSSDWAVVSSPNDGLNAAADINFDERVDAADLGQMLAAWGDAPRNDYPPSDCPLGLIP